MMTEKIVGIHNSQTNEFVERVINEQELAQLKLDQEQAAKNEKANMEAKDAKSALLDRLGITEAEAKLLLS